MTRVAVDTNILVYAAGFGDAPRCAAADAVLRFIAGRLAVPVQVMGELFNVLARKARLPLDDIAHRLALLGAGADVLATTPAAFSRACELAAEHRIQIWDAVIMAVVEAEDCEVLLSEDLQDGFQWRRLTIINPFAHPTHPLIVGRTRF